MDNDCNRDYETDKLYSELVPELRATIAELRAEVERLKSIGQQFERDARKHFDQSCQNLERATKAEADRDALRARCEAMTKERDDLFTLVGFYRLYKSIAESRIEQLEKPREAAEGAKEAGNG